MRLIFLRHGESEYNRRGLCNADPGLPVPLTATGLLQARDAARRLADVPIRRVFVSRLWRAQETAAIVNAGHGAHLRVDARLDDRSTGFEDQPVADYLDTQQRAPDPFAWKAPGGESYRELVARVHGFLAEVCMLDEAAVLVVTHHQVMQAAAGYFRELTPADMWRVWVDNGATLEFDTADAC